MNMKGTDTHFAFDPFSFKCIQVLVVIYSETSISVYGFVLVFWTSLSNVSTDPFFIQDFYGFIRKTKALISLDLIEWDNKGIVWTTLFQANDVERQGVIY